MILIEERYYVNPKEMSCRPYNLINTLTNRKGLYYTVIYYFPYDPVWITKR